MTDDHSSASTLAPGTDTVRTASAEAEADGRAAEVVALDDPSLYFNPERFQSQIFPALTPLAVGPGRPFPYISNLSLSLAVLVRDPATEQVAFARVKVPKEILPRFVAVSDFAPLVPLEDVIADNLGWLFPGMEVVDYAFFRVTRDADLDLSDESGDLLAAVENELRRRRFGEGVRVEV